jgi:hypothetical protein
MTSQQALLNVQINKKMQPKIKKINSMTISKKKNQGRNQLESTKNYQIINNKHPNHKLHNLLYQLMAIWMMKESDLMTLDNKKVRLKLREDQDWQDIMREESLMLKKLSILMQFQLIHHSL